jgi:hypothetical protein
MPGTAGRGVALAVTLTVTVALALAVTHSLAHPFAYRYSFDQRIFDDRVGGVVNACPDWLVHGNRLGFLSYGDRLGVGVLGLRRHDCGLS